MNSRVQQFIENNIEYIDRNDFHNLYQEAQLFFQGYTEEIAEVTQALIACDIYPLAYLNYVPRYYMVNNYDLKILNDLPIQIHTIGTQAYTLCDNLIEVDLSHNVNLFRINSEAFYNCKNLKRVILPNRLDYIGSYAFSDCPNLEYLHLGDNLEVIGFYAFQNCYKLMVIEINDSFDNFKNKVSVPNNAFTGIPDICEFRFTDQIMRYKDYKIKKNT